MSGGDLDLLRVDLNLSTIRDNYFSVSTDQRLVLWCFNQSENSIYLSCLGDNDRVRDLDLDLNLLG